MSRTPKFFCRNHPSTAANFGCEDCKGTYCESCTTSRNFAYGRIQVCPECGAPLLPIEIPLAGQEDSFVTAIASSLKCPVADTDGRWTVGGAGVAFGFFVGLTGFGLAGSIARLIALACLISYAERAIRRVASGIDGVPDWPEWSHWNDWFVTILKTVFTLAFAFAPALYAYSVHAGSTVLYLAIAAGAVYWPMSWIATTMTRQIVAISPHVVLPALFRADPFYWVAVPFSLLLFAGLQAFSGFLPVGMPIIVRPVVFTVIYGLATYVVLVLGRVLGLVYLRTGGRFGW